MGQSHTLFGSSAASSQRSPMYQRSSTGSTAGAGSSVSSLVSQGGIFPEFLLAHTSGVQGVSAVDVFSSLPTPC